MFYACMESEEYAKLVLVWTEIGNFLLKLQASGLGHDAVIEIMIALLGIMLTVLALIAAVFGFFGFKAIKDEAISIAEVAARETAKQVAEQIAVETLKAIRNREQATGLSESQVGEIGKLSEASQRRRGSRVKAVSDKDLSKTRDNDDT